MRIDNLSTAYPLDRPARSSSVNSSYREVKPVDDVRSDLPSDEALGSTNATYRNVEAVGERGSIQAEHLPARYSDLAERYQQPMSARAAQALSSYGATANMVRNVDANEVVGLDLYA